MSRKYHLCIYYVLFAQNTFYRMLFRIFVVFFSYFVLNFWCGVWYLHDFYAFSYFVIQFRTQKFLFSLNNWYICYYVCDRQIKWIKRTNRSRKRERKKSKEERNKPTGGKTKFQSLLPQTVYCNGFIVRSLSYQRYWTKHLRNYFFFLSREKLHAAKP